MGGAFVALAAPGVATPTPSGEVAELVTFFFFFGVGAVDVACASSVEAFTAGWAGVAGVADVPAAGSAGVAGVAGTVPPGVVAGGAAETVVPNARVPARISATFMSIPS